LKRGPFKKKERTKHLAMKGELVKNDKKRKSGKGEKQEK